MTFKEVTEKARNLLFHRRYAYNQLFNRKSPFFEIVVKDLARFCRAHDSTFHEDPRIHAMVEGRREVWLRIQRYLNLSPDELWSLFNKGVKDG